MESNYSATCFVDFKTLLAVNMNDEVLTLLFPQNTIKVTYSNKENCTFDYEMIVKEVKSQKDRKKRLWSVLAYCIGTTIGFLIARVIINLI